MITYRNINDNPNMVALAKLGPFTVYEHQKDLRTAWRARRSPTFRNR